MISIKGIEFDNLIDSFKQNEDLRLSYRHNWMLYHKGSWLIFKQLPGENEGNLIYSHYDFSNAVQNLLIL